jgi:hypothetical protein
MDPIAFTCKLNFPRTVSLGSAIVTSTAWFAAILIAFHGVSRDDWLSDTPQARRAVAGCNALRDRAARGDCVRELMVAARARDVGQATPYQLALSISTPDKAKR